MSQRCLGSANGKCHAMLPITRVSGPNCPHAALGDRSEVSCLGLKAATLNLSVREHRIEHVADVLDDRIAHNLGHAASRLCPSLAGALAVAD